MSSYSIEQATMDAMSSELRWASVLQTVGWILLGFNAIPACLVFVGFRSGTYFWLYWTMIEGAIGFGLTVAGGYLKTNAGRHTSRLVYEDQEKEAA